MSASEENVATRLALILRRYGWIVAVAVVATLSAAMFVSPQRPARQTEYEAVAVVVATNLAIRPEGLPRFAQAIFDTGTVAERGRLIGDVPYPAAELARDHVRLEPIENAIAMRVVGSDPDAVLATTIANSIASAFVDELNKAGPGVGTFAVQDVARQPTKPVDVSQIPVLLLVAVVSGLLLGLGAAGLMGAVRHPVLTAQEAGAAVGVQVVANLDLRPRRSQGAVPAGIATVARAVFPNGCGLGALVSTSGGESVCTEVAIRTGRALAVGGATYLVSSAASMPEAEVATLILTPSLPPDDTASAAPVLVDQPTEIDLLHLVPAGARILVVVVAGTRAAAVARVADNFLPGEIHGVVFVRAPSALFQRLSFRAEARAPMRRPEIHDWEARQREALRGELAALRDEIDRAGTTLRVMVREAAELRRAAHAKLETELQDRRAQLLSQTRQTAARNAPPTNAPPTNAPPTVPTEQPSSQTPR